MTTTDAADPAISGAALGPDDVDDPHHREEALASGRRSWERIPVHYQDAVLDQPAVQDWVRQLVAVAAGSGRVVPKVDTGPSLLLLGGTGTGKTHTAYAAIRALTASGVGCPWACVTAADLYARLRPRHRIDPEAEFERYLRVGVLVLDDLGAAKGSEWNEEVNYRLINHRYEHHLPTLITSNVTPRELRAALGERVASRLVEMAQRVVLDGHDRRRAVQAVRP